MGPRGVGFQLSRHLPRGGTERGLALLAYAGTAAWTLGVCAVLLGAASTPKGLLGFLTLLTLAPAALVSAQAVPALRRLPALRECAVWTLIVGAAALFAVIVSDRPRVAVALPLVVAAGLIATRRPAAVMTFLIALTAFYGSFTAFVYISAGPTGIDYSRISDSADLALAGLLVAALWVHVMRRGQERLRITPAMVLVTLYIVLTLVEVFTAATFRGGMDSFRASGWHEAALFTVALCCWQRATAERAARAGLVIALVAGAYAVFRILVGAARDEALLAMAAGNNFLGDRLGLLGSFPTRHGLGTWMAVAVPFCAGCALSMSGRWRMIATSATALCAIAAIGSEVRVALVAMLAGMTAVAACALVARALPRIRGGTLVALAAGAIALTGVAFALTSTHAGLRAIDRFTVLFTPSRDVSYQEHLRKWELALEDVSDHPFGQGLGTAGIIGERQNRFLSAADPGLDSSYLKVAFEQGIFVLLLFTAGLALLAYELGRAAARLADRERAGLAMAACGALVALIVEFATGLYVQSVTVLAGWAFVGLGVAQLMYPERE